MTGRPVRRGKALAAAALVAIPVLLSACAGAEQSGTPAHRVSTWVSGAGAGSAIGTLRADNTSIDRALAAHKPPAAIRTVCALLANDASAGNSNLPTPDDRLTNDLEAAYQVEYSAGSDCYHGAAGNAALLRRSADERRRGAASLVKAVERITAVTGRVPSTTTTTAPGGNSGDPFAPS